MPGAFQSDWSSPFDILDAVHVANLGSIRRDRAPMEHIHRQSESIECMGPLSITRSFYAPDWLTRSHFSVLPTFAINSKTDSKPKGVQNAPCGTAP